MIINLNRVRCDYCGDDIEIAGISSSWLRRLAAEQGWRVFADTIDYCPCCVGILTTPSEELEALGYQGRYQKYPDPFPWLFIIDIPHGTVQI